MNSNRLISFFNIQQSFRKYQEMPDVSKQKTLMENGMKSYQTALFQPCTHCSDHIKYEMFIIICIYD